MDLLWDVCRLLRFQLSLRIHPEFRWFAGRTILDGDIRQCRVIELPRSVG